MTPAQSIGCCVGPGQREYLQDEDLRIPEGMAIVAWTRQPFGCYGPTLRTSSGLQDVEESEAHRLLDLRVALQLDVGIGPEVIQVGPLLGEQAIPASQLC